MRNALLPTLRFALFAFLVVLVLDALLSLLFQPPPASENWRAFLFTHGLFHAAVLVLSLIGAGLGFTVIRSRLPSASQNLGLALAYGLVTPVTSFGAFLFAGVLGVVVWLLLGSMSFALGAALFGRPWRRTQ